MDNDLVMEKGIRQSFGSPAGKKHLSKRIVSLIPEHKTYLEIFAGGGAVFFMKLPSEVEVLNDKDSEIAFAYRFMRDLTDDQLNRLKKYNWVITEETFDRSKKLKPKDEVERFYRFIYLTRGGYGGDRNASVNPAAVKEKRKIAIVDQLPRLKDRLRNVKIYNKDYKEILDKYNSKDAFWYLDPPYPAKAGFEGLQVDLKELKDRVARIKGKWILSLDDSSDNRKLFSGFHIRRVKTIESIAEGGGDSSRTELLIANYPLQKKNLYLEKGSETLTREEFLKGNYPVDPKVLYEEFLKECYPEEAVPIILKQLNNLNQIEGGKKVGENILYDTEYELFEKDADTKTVKSKRIAELVKYIDFLIEVSEPKEVKDFLEKVKEVIGKMKDDKEYPKPDKYPATKYPKKKDGTLYSQESIEDLEKELEDLKTKFKVEKAFKEYEGAFGEEDAAFVKDVLKKSLMNEPLTLEEAEKLTSIPKKGSGLLASTETIIKSMDESERSRLLRLGGIKTRVEE